MDALRSCSLNFRKWLHNPRYWIVIAVLVVFTRNTAAAFREVSVLSDKMLSPWLLPFLLIDRYTLFCLALSLIILFCDAPFLDLLQPYALQRIGRRRRLLGQFCYVFFCSLAVVLFLWLCMLCVCAGRIEWVKDWGPCLKMLAHDNPFWGAFAQEIILQQDALTVFLRTILMSCGVASLIGMLLLYLNLHLRREVGAFIVSGISVIDFVLYSYFDSTPELFWISPISWMNPWQYVGDDQSTWKVRFGIVLALLGTLGALSIRKLLRCHIETAPEL